MRNPWIRRLALASLLVLAAPAFAALHPEESVPFDLTQGSLSVGLAADEDSSQLVVRLSNSFPGIVGVILRAAGQEKDLLWITASKAAPMLKEALAPRVAAAAITIEGVEVVGDFDTRLFASVEGVDHLQVLLVNSDAELRPLDIYSQTWLGSTFTFESLPGEDVQCKKVWLECTSSDGTNCSTSTTCCGNLSVCADCDVCTITCPPCVRLPNGDSP